VCDSFVDDPDGVPNPKPGVPVVTIAKFYSLVFTAGPTGWNVGCATLRGSF
jgi:hypothetical protein